MALIQHRYKDQQAKLEEEYGRELSDATAPLIRVRIIENITDVASEYIRKHGGGCGSQCLILKQGHLDALKRQQVLVISPQAEYDVFIVFEGSR